MQKRTSSSKRPKKSAKKSERFIVLAKKAYYEEQENCLGSFVSVRDTERGETWILRFNSPSRNIYLNKGSLTELLRDALASVVTALQDSVKS